MITLKIKINIGNLNNNHNNMKILEFKTKILKIMKVLEFMLESCKNENFRVSCDNYKKTKQNHVIPFANYKSHEILRIPYRNFVNLRILCKNY